MLGVAPSEAVVIGLVALVVLGPQGFARTAAQLGATVRAFRSALHGPDPAALAATERREHAPARNNRLPGAVPALRLAPADALDPDALAD